MKFESRFYQIITVISDWVLRIVMLNIMMIITMLPIVTIFPALSAGYNMFSDYFNYDDKPLIKGYFGYFVKDFKKKFSLNLVLILLIILAVSNTRYYMLSLEANGNTFEHIGYYVSLFLLIGLFIITLYVLTVHRVYPRIKLFLLFKVSFFLAGKFLFRSILLVLSLLIPLVMFTFPFTMMMFVFTGVSIMIMVNVYITKPAVDYLESLGENHV